MNDANKTPAATVTVKINAKGAARITIERNGQKCRSTMSAKKVAKGGTYRVLVGTTTAAGAAFYLDGVEGSMGTLGNWDRTSAPAEMLAAARELEARGNEAGVEVVEVAF